MPNLSPIFYRLGVVFPGGVGYNKITLSVPVCLPEPTSAGCTAHCKGGSTIMMKKSTFGAVLLFLAAAVGVLTAVALYLRRREKELDEYEKLLFSDEYDDEDEADDDAEDDEVEAAAPGTEPAPNAEPEV